MGLACQTWSRTTEALASLLPCAGFAPLWDLLRVSLPSEQSRALQNAIHAFDIPMDDDLLLDWDSDSLDWEDEALQPCPTAQLSGCRPPSPVQLAVQASIAAATQVAESLADFLVAAKDRLASFHVFLYDERQGFYDDSARESAGAAVWRLISCHLEEVERGLPCNLSSCMKRGLHCWQHPTQPGLVLTICPELVCKFMPAGECHDRLSALSCMLGAMDLYELVRPARDRLDAADERLMQAMRAHERTADALHLAELAKRESAAMSAGGQGGRAQVVFRNEQAVRPPQLRHVQRCQCH